MKKSQEIFKLTIKFNQKFTDEFSQRNFAQFPTIKI